MQLVWPFRGDSPFVLDEYVETVMNLVGSRTVARIKESFADFASEYGVGIFEVAVVIVILLFVVAFFYSLSRQWPLMLPSRDGLRPPPGTMGWPFFGETAQLKANRLSFYLERRKKYGETFKSHLFGNPCIVTTSSQAAKFVLVDHPELFRRRSLPSVERMLGTHFFGYTANHGSHLTLRKQLHGLIAHLPNLIPHLESQALSLMRSWLGGREVHVLQETKLVSLFTIINLQ